MFGPQLDYVCFRVQSANKVPNLDNGLGFLNTCSSWGERGYG